MTVNVTVWVVGDGNGSYAADTVSVNTVISNANQALRPTAITLQLAGGVINYTNNPDWVTLNYSNVVAGGYSYWVFPQALENEIASLPKTVPGPRVVFVDTIRENVATKAGLHSMAKYIILANVAGG